MLARISPAQLDTVTIITNVDIAIPVSVIIVSFDIFIFALLHSITILSNKGALSSGAHPAGSLHKSKVNSISRRE